MIKTSIVIPTYNKLSRLKISLKALESEVTPEVEVIVVFDGCTSEVIEEFKRLQFSYEPVVVICEKNGGRSVARNRGNDVAKGDIIIYMDDDRIPEKGFVKKHMRWHEHENCAVMGGRRQLTLTEEQLEHLYEDMSYLETLKKDAPREPVRELPMLKPTSRNRWLCFYTGNLSMRRSEIEKAGRFDEKFVKWGNEDIDLGIRVELNGIPFYMDDDIVSYHIAHGINYFYRVTCSIESLRYMVKKYKKNKLVHLTLKLLLFHSILMRMAEIVRMKITGKP